MAQEVVRSSVEGVEGGCLLSANTALKCWRSNRDRQLLCFVFLLYEGSGRRCSESAGRSRVGGWLLVVLELVY